MQNDEQFPLVSFHGTEDNVVPYDVGFAFNMTFLPLHGSAAVERQCQRLSISSKLQTFVGMGHGIPSLTDPRADTLIAVTRDFLYEHLIDNTPIVHVAATKHVIHNPARIKMIYTRGTASNNYPLNLNITGIMYSINGKRLGAINLNAVRKTSGFFVIKNSRNIE